MRVVFVSGTYLHFIIMSIKRFFSSIKMSRIRLRPILFYA